MRTFGMTRPRCEPATNRMIGGHVNFLSDTVNYRGVRILFGISQLTESILTQVMRRDIRSCDLLQEICENFGVYQFDYYLNPSTLVRKI